jgi:hypothetical protein
MCTGNVQSDDAWKNSCSSQNSGDPMSGSGNGGNGSGVGGGAIGNCTMLSACMTQSVPMIGGVGIQTGGCARCARVACHGWN